VLTEHKDNQYAVFTANTRYWGEKPRIQSVRWKVMPDHQSMLLGLQKGEVDLIFGADGDMLNLDSFEGLRRQGKYVTEISQPIASRAILLNAHQPFTQERGARLALRIMAQATQQHQTIQSDRQEDESQYNAHCRSLPCPGTGRATSHRPWRAPRHVFHRLRAQSLMFDSLSQRLARIVKTMRGEARLTEANTQEMLREIRIALLEADVALPVVRDFIARAGPTATCTWWSRRSSTPPCSATATT